MATDNKIKLGIPEISALIVLMVENREVSNPEMEKLAGITLTNPASTKLVELGFVTWRQGAKRAFCHTLTRDGFGYCRALSIDDRPKGSGSAGGALFALLAGMNRALDGLGDRDREFFDVPSMEGPEKRIEEVSVDKSAPADDLEFRVRQVYKSSATQPGDWVGLADLRDALSDVPRADLDEELRRLSRQQTINVIPKSNQQALTTRDRDAALLLGGDPNHVFKIEDA